jgi:hypothetical protein
MRVRRVSGLVLAVLILTPTASADGPQGTVDDRAKAPSDTDYDAQGIRLSSFLAFPSLEFSLRRDDNVFATDSDEVKDEQWIYRPSLLVQSTWSRHFLSLAVDSEITRYNDESDEEHTDWGAVAEGRLDISRTSRLGGKLSFQNRTEDRAALEAIPTLRKPTEYEEFAAQASLRKRINRLHFGLGGGFTRLDYEDGSSVGGGTVDADFRDREMLRSVAELGYSLTQNREAGSNYRVFVRGSVNARRYDKSPPDVVFERDSDGYDLVLGLASPLTNLLHGEIFMGYMKQSYDDGAFRDVNGMSFGFDLEWSPTRLTTVRLSGARKIVDSTTPGAGGILTTQAGIGLDHELRRNLLLRGEFFFTNGDFKGIRREDDVTSASFGVRYLVSRRVHIDIEYRFDDRDSDVSSLDYSRNRITIGIRLQH